MSAANTEQSEESTGEQRTPHQIRSLYEQCLRKEKDLRANRRSSAAYIRDSLAWELTFPKRWFLIAADPDTGPAGLVAEGQKYLALLEVLRKAPNRDTRWYWMAQSEVSAPFLRSLDGDTQHFVFTSLLTYDLLVSSYRLAKQKAYESLATDSLGASETQDKLDADLARYLSQSAVQTSVLYDMLEKSSSWYRDDYFAKNPPKPKGAASTTGELTGEERQRVDVLVRQGFRELRQEVEDLGDSLKAAQNYLISQFEQHQQSASVHSTFLRSELGDDVYGQLDFNTRRMLQLGEYQYHQNKEPDGYNPCVISYCCAYEMEFTARITKPVVAELLKRGIKEYPPNSERKFAILVQGNVNHIALGSALWHLRKNEMLRQIVHSLKLNVHLLIAGATRIVALRNPIAHNQFADRAYADRVRKLMLGSASVLKDLIP